MMLKSAWEFFKSYGRSVLLFICITAALVFGVASQKQQMDEENLRILESALHRAMIQCYAIEARYPGSVEYLEENYGVYIDREKYIVYYNGFATNIMPTITVIPIE